MSAASALPVQLSLRGRLVDPVRRLVEGQLGWQPIDDDTAGLVPPAARLADVQAEAAQVPTILLVVETDHPAAAARAAQRLRPAVVAPWPLPAAELAAHADAATRAGVRRPAPVQQLRLGGAGGGVGTTTVAAALAGLAAWQGDTALLVSPDATVVPGRAPSVAPDALLAPDLWSRAVALSGVERCRAVRLTETPGADVAVADPRIDVTVIDVGVADDVDVLVCAPDARGLAALERTTAAVVVVVGDGPVARRSVAAAVGARRRIELPRSARVARAGALGRVPTSLPGRFVHTLGPLLPPGPSARGSTGPD